MSNILIFDTETTGVYDFKADCMAEHQPNLVQLAARMEDAESARVLAEVNIIIEPSDWTIPEEASAIHGISQATAKSAGVALANSIYLFRDLFTASDIVIAHNIAFDRAVIRRAVTMAGVPDLPWEQRDQRCTMLKATPVVKVPHARKRHPNDWKWPKLSECVRFFFGEELVGAHDALVDVRACGRVYRALVAQGCWQGNA